MVYVRCVFEEFNLIRGKLVSEFKRGNYYLVNFLWFLLIFIEFFIFGLFVNFVNIYCYVM